LVFGGTTESRTLLERGFPALCCVATDYGAKLLEGLDNVTPLVGRLDAPAMEALFRREGITHVIDATHPYAVEVTRNIRAACEAAGIKLLRVARPRTQLPESAVVAASAEEAAELLNATDERVLLTVGSKELPAFAGVTNAKTRLFARVLPTSSVIAQCEALGYDAGHIVAMQGPFSRAMNEAMFAATGAKTLVTKDGGASGGMEDKLAAAESAGARVIVIGRSAEDGATLDEAVLWARRELGLSRPPLFPMLIPLEGKKALVIGGGPIALRRARTLLRCGASVTAVALKFCEGWSGLHCQQCVRSWLPDDLCRAAVAVAATDSRDENHAIALEANRRGVPVSVADNAAEGTFSFPSLIEHDGASINVSTAGLDPALTRRLADRLRAIWPQIVTEERHKKEENNG
ncbi:MAG: precorrin-6A reductase, partial [Pyramidobacter sp.]|nr:precorrin-6A reductase [Pyramidobacter sp.]